MPARRPPTSAAAWWPAVDGRATRVYRARNAEASPLRYTIHPQDQFRITMEIEEHGEEIAAIYHSHTSSPAKPSQTDINLAENWPGSSVPDLLARRAGGPERSRLLDPRRRVEEVELDVE